MKIRKATIDDAAAMTALGKSMMGESPTYAGLSFDDYKLNAFITWLINTPESGIAYVAVHNNEIVGGLIAMVSEYWFSDDKYSSDLAVFILPEHRGGRCASILVKNYIQDAKSLGVKNIMLGTTTGINADRTSEFYKAIGFEPVGGIFLMRNR